MEEAEVARIAEHVTYSWPTQTLDPATATLWLKDFKLLDFETMIMAVDGLRRTQDFLPTTHQLIEAHGHTWVELHPRLPAHDDTAEQDPRRPYNLAWRLLTETWMHVKGASFKVNADKTATARNRKLLLQVHEEIQALHKAHTELMPPGPDAMAPERLVALAVAAQERVRKLLFGAEAATGSADEPKGGTIGHQSTESPPPPAYTDGRGRPAPHPLPPAMPFDDSRVEDPDDFYE